MNWKKMPKIRYVLLILILALTILIGQDNKIQGKYFYKKQYTKKTVPEYDNCKNKLPQPILDERPVWIEMYWKCWEIAFPVIQEPEGDSPLVSQWLDEAFSENIFQWDTIFMIMFARYGNHIFPAVKFFDNFYCLMDSSGYICREYRESDGKAIHYAEGELFHPQGWKNTINPLLFGWAEYESYKLSGNKKRLERVSLPLEKYDQWLEREGDSQSTDWRTQGRGTINTKHNLYWNTPLGSGMDNTPRPIGKGIGWIDMSSQMVIMYNYLSKIFNEIGELEKRKLYQNKARAIKSRINEYCWDSEIGLYFDVLAKGNLYRKKTAASFWPLLAGIPTKKQASKMIEHHKNEDEFWRPFIFTTLAAYEEEYAPNGNY